MEKRTFLAFVLSFLVLFAWSILFPPPKPATKSQKESQIIENKENASVEAISKQSQVDFVEKTYFLENSKLKVELTNRGGVIKDIYLKEFNKRLPITNIVSVSNFNDKEFIVDSQDSDQIIFLINEDGNQVLKKYIISENDYIVQSEIENSSTKLGKIKFFDLNISKVNKQDVNFHTEKSLFEYFAYAGKDFVRKNNATTFSEKDSKNITGLLKFVGFRDRYFSFIVKPSESIENIEFKTIEKELFSMNYDSKNTREAFTIFYGPEDRHLLKEYGFGFEKVKMYYRLGLFDVTAKAIESMMFFIHKIVPNWGVCIILLGAIVYFSMYPLTLKSMTSMKKMQVLQPKIQALKEKHAANPQKLNKEIMELYKIEKINPLGGCLPIILQMPVFIGLYQVLWRSVSLKNANFLWIKDLSEPDRLFIMKYNLPIIGNEINLLPLLMVVIMYFQQKMSAKNMVITSPDQKMQQQMMTTIMPVFLGFIFYKFASGLTVYFTMFYLFSLFTQWKMSKVTYS
jgi:YidC/Oxa1 family membrane protein insertase